MKVYKISRFVQGITLIIFV